MAWEGEKVKLDIVKMVVRKDWENLNKDYKKWVLKNQDNIFTVEFDPKRRPGMAKNSTMIVQLVEDETVPKWLFYAGDLIQQPGQTPPDFIRKSLMVSVCQMRLVRFCHLSCECKVHDLTLVDVKLCAFFISFIDAV